MKSLVKHKIFIIHIKSYHDYKSNLNVIKMKNNFIEKTTSLDYTRPLIKGRMVVECQKG